MRAQRSGFAALNASDPQTLRRVCNEALYFIDAPGFPAMTSGCNTQAPASERCQQTSSLSPKGLLVKWVMVGSEVMAGAVGKFLSLDLLFHVFYAPHSCIPESAIWGLRAF